MLSCCLAFLLSCLLVGLLGGWLGGWLADVSDTHTHRACVRSLAVALCKGCERLVDQRGCAGGIHPAPAGGRDRAHHTCEQKRPAVVWLSSLILTVAMKTDRCRCQDRPETHKRTEESSPQGLSVGMFAQGTASFVRPTTLSSRRQSRCSGASHCRCRCRRRYCSDAPRKRGSECTLTFCEQTRACSSTQSRTCLRVYCVRVRLRTCACAWTG